MRAITATLPRLWTAGETVEIQWRWNKLHMSLVRSCLTRFRPELWKADGCPYITWRSFLLHVVLWRCQLFSRGHWWISCIRRKLPRRVWMVDIRAMMMIMMMPWTVLRAGQAIEYDTVWLCDTMMWCQWYQSYYQRMMNHDDTASNSIWHWFWQQKCQRNGSII